MSQDSDKTLQLATEIVERLHKAGHDAYFAGGCVRDKLLGLPAKDYDIATSARPSDIQKLFPKTIPVGVQFGVILVVESGIPFEVATFRTEGNYEDGRRPQKVSFTDVQSDAKRRDFTVNGLYYDLRTKKVLDFVGGEKDLQQKLIRSIGKAEDRFLEDHLRMLRAARFAVQLGFSLDPETETAITKHAALIGKVSQERIREEFSKLLISPSPAVGIRLLDKLGLLKHFLPEVLVLKGVEQPAQYHPEGDVFVHTLMLLEGMGPNPPLELALGCLFHDIAKPATFERAEDRIRFHGHDRVGEEMTRKILKRLTYSNDQIDLVCALVRDHLKFKDAFQMRQSTLRRFLSEERFDLHLELHRLDCLASHKDLQAYEFCKKKYEEFKQLPPPPLRLINGEDLTKMGYLPGPSMGKILRAVEDAILEGDVLTREAALSFVKANFPRDDKK
ncbi:MAG: CCA tRNA nucleotidyltransferase [Bdellovibrionales bacterium]|nr:CCA tRNA nucleotidyltransferase [Bdellovibrionales bacterium]